MKEIENANTMEANATRCSVYTIQKYTLTYTSNTFLNKPTTINQQADRQVWEGTLRTFCRLKDVRI